MANKIELRKLNRNLIYRCIYENDGISRQEIASRTGLSIPTVVQNLTDLEEKGLITADGVFESTGGRRARVIRCIHSAACAVGIDITQNHVTIVVVDMAGTVVASKKREIFPYEDTPAFYDGVAQRLMNLLESNGIDQSRILGVGISLPCIVDRKNNRVTYGKILPVHEDICALFAQRIPFRIELFNDANAGGFAENWNRQERRMCFYLMLSNSVGGAIIREDGTIYQGNHGRSAEIGHVKIIPNGGQCYCGQRGCVNVYCSAKLLSDCTDGNLEMFFTQLDQGNPAFQKIFDTYLDHLSTTVSNIRMLFDCVIILGGYVGAYMDRYMDRLAQRLSVTNPYETDSTYVLPCRYKIEASAVGAGLPFIREFIEAI